MFLVMCPRSCNRTGEGGQHLGAWHPTRHRRQDPFPQVKRITTHVGKYGTRSRFMPTAVVC